MLNTIQYTKALNQIKFRHPMRRRQDDLWRRSALQKLPVLMDSTDMLVCGEDLGFVPECVPPVMQVGLRD